MEEPPQPPDTTNPWLVTRNVIMARIKADLEAEAAAARELCATRIPVVARVVAEARAAGLCRRVWLFGSYADGNPRETSDIDVLVEGDADAVATRIEAVLPVAVDAWRFDAAPESLKETAFQWGVVL